MKKLLVSLVMVCGLLFIVNVIITAAQTDENYYGEIARDFMENPEKYSGQNGTAGAAEDNWDLKFSEPSITGDTQFGNTVTGVGDVNGDGYDDVLVGAYKYNSSTGRVYLFYGGPTMDTTADLIMTGESERNYFGKSIAGAGDVNGDGYCDFLVGADRIDEYTGRVYLYYGGLSMDNNADVIMTGEETVNDFGCSVAIVGDVNKDGYDDILIGAKRAERAYLYYGGPTMDNTADVIMNGDQNSTWFGSSVTGVGDVNNDGYADVLISASNPWNSNLDRVFLFHGSPMMDNIADVVMVESDNNDNFGSSIAGAGDVNNDGYDDILIGAPDNNTRRGRVYLYYGGLNMDNNPDIILSGKENNDYYGISVAGAGDINHDGYTDIMIGARIYNNPGKVYLYYGGSEMDTIADIILTVGNAQDDNFGNSIANAGDINNDGYEDLLIGDWSFSNETGRAYLYYCTPVMDSIADVVLTGEATAYEFGYSVAGAGDVNGDGYDDILVGALNSSNLYEGQVYLYYGGSAIDNNADLVFDADSLANGFGCSVAGVGDVNGDGFDDVLIGARYGYQVGRAYLYYGGSAMDTDADVIFTGEAIFHNFGNKVAAAGDVNNDGYADMLVCTDVFEEHLGWAYLFYGGATVDSVADIVFAGESVGDYFGQDIAGAGDVNGDGFDDVLVKAADRLKCYNLYYGGSSMDAVADVVFNGTQFGSFISITGAGDVNNDGYDDVLIGASSKYIGPGHAYLYYGGSAMDNIADIDFFGETSGDNFGYRVAGIGDVNKDGYADIAVSNADFYGNWISSCYMFKGGSSMDHSADHIESGEVINDQFGSSIAGVGDVNGDGYGDFIIGAPRAGENYNGAAYLYFGNQTLDVKEEDSPLSVPNRAQLCNNYPNPFNPATNIEFELPARANVEVVVYDVTGKQVRSLLHEWRNGGRHRVCWDGRNDAGMPVSSGVYLCRFSTDKGYAETKKMTLVK